MSKVISSYDTHTQLVLEHIKDGGQHLVSLRSTRREDVGRGAKMIVTPTKNRAFAESEFNYWRDHYEQRRKEEVNAGENHQDGR